MFLKFPIPPELINIGIHDLFRSKLGVFLKFPIPPELIKIGIHDLFRSKLGVFLKFPIPPELINIVPATRLSHKKSGLPTIIFQGLR